LNLPLEKQDKDQKFRIKLQKEAFNFFGPCKTCGDTNLTHLTISHIHDNGAEKRKNREGGGTKLLQKFRNLGWPESLKEDYCLECFSCNCSKNKE
jgi:hypothetical protein